MDDVKKMVLDYVIREYLEDGDDREIGYDTPLISGGIVDSFSMVSLKRFLEKKYSIQIPDADATPEAFDTVNSIVALVERFEEVREVRHGIRRHTARDVRTSKELAGIRDAGLFKEERYIRSPQGGGHRGRIPGRRAAEARSSTSAPTTTSGSPATPRSSRRRTQGLDDRGYGMSSVRFICGTQDIHRELEKKLTEVPRHRGHDAVPLLHGRQRRRVRGRARRSRTS